MSEIIKEKLPDIHSLVLKLGVKANWEEIREDLEELHYLSLSEFQDFNLCDSVWKISDRWITSELSLKPRYSIFKFFKVKTTLSSHFSRIPKAQVRSICETCMEKSQTLGFLEKAASSLNDCSQDTFTKIALRINELFGVLKQTIIAVFMHFERHIKAEFAMNLVEIMDQAFYEKVFFPHRPQLNQDGDTKKILIDLEKNQKSKGSCDDSATPTNAFSYKGINKYLGEVNQENQRNGYGKVAYYGGDSYEGYWRSDKRHGQGLYMYKFGGRYLGNFENDLPSGEGCKVYMSGNVYDGEFRIGKKHGNGQMRFKNGDLFEGRWENDDMHGQGRYTWSSGDFFVGEFVRDKREGNGVLHLATGEIIEGVWKDGVMQVLSKDN